MKTTNEQLLTINIAQLDHVTGGAGSRARAASAIPTFGSPPPVVVDRDPLQPQYTGGGQFTHATF